MELVGRTAIKAQALADFYVKQQGRKRKPLMLIIHGEYL